jgi:hypothetical protein
VAVTIDTGPLSGTLDRALETAMTLMRADRGNIQLADPATGALRIASQAGFDAEFLEYFAVVDDDASACGRAAQQQAQVVINDVTTEAGFAPHRDIAASSRFRAVQSTPLVSASGLVVGMLSTHYPAPRVFSIEELQAMEQLGLLIGASIVGDDAPAGAPPAPSTADALETRPGRVVKVSVDGYSAVILTRESGLTPENAWADLVNWLHRKGHIG